MKKVSIPIIALLLFILGGCGRFNNKENDKAEKRVLSIAKQYTEIIFALGAEKDLIAVDLSSTYPDAAKQLPTVGYHRALSVEGILAVKPDLILHDNNIGPEHVVKQLEDLKIPMKVFGKYKDNIAGTDSLIREMGVYFNRQAVADSLCKQLDADMGIALEQSKQYKDSVKVLVIHYGQANNVYLVMTQKSTAAKMIAWAGGKITVTDEKGMKQLSPEAIAAADPDVILLTDFGYDKLGSIEKIKELPGLAKTRAANNNRIYRVEEHDMVYLGPRTGKNVLALQKLIHDQSH
ncbi:MAG: heme/hemin ABC transporter substrate-binding protein [Sediminibacterium sp.]